MKPVSVPVLVTPLRMTGGEWKHGTDNGYTNHGCRCYWCKRARSEYAEKWRERSGVPEHVHGTYNGYTNYLCRCEGCRQAYSKTKSMAYQRRKDRRLNDEKPPHSGE